VTSVTTGPTRAGAPFVGVRGSLMLTTARSVPSARKMYVLTLQHGMELFHCITGFNCGGVTVNKWAVVLKKVLYQGYPFVTPPS